VFDRDLTFDKLNSIYHQAQNLLLRFKAWIVELSRELFIDQPAEDHPQASVNQDQ
jgi:hypothetical protein